MVELYLNNSIFILKKCMCYMEIRYKYIFNFIKFLKLSYYVNICIILIYDFIMIYLIFLLSDDCEKIYS